jgi:molybdenum-dependent DNA-binding transcriptional regulator ModE
MLKSEAIALLGGSVGAAAESVGVSYQAVVKWPDELPTRIADRVQAAMWRRSQGLPPPTREVEPEGGVR